MRGDEPKVIAADGTSAIDVSRSETLCFRQFDFSRWP